MSSEQQANGSGVAQSSVTYSYDADGNKLTQTTTPAGGTASTTSWTYDKLDRAANMSGGSHNYVYDPNGNVTQSQVSNSGTQTVQTQAQYDGGNRLTSLKDFVGPGSSNPLHSYSYGYDAAGNRNSMTEDGTTTTSTYDGDNQLLSVTSGGTTTTYTYDANHNRTSMTLTSGGTTTTTSYSYDTATTDTLLQQKTDPSGTVTTYAYDTNGNLLTATYDPSGADQVTTYKYDSSNRLTEIDEPASQGGTTISFGYDANGNRDQKSVTTGGINPTTTQVNDTFQNGRLAYQTGGDGTLLATFTYDPSGVPESVVVGTDPVNGPRDYYVYNGHGDVVALTDASGNVVASYSYDVWGNLLSASENFANGWTNPYRYDGRDGARYDVEMGLYWLSTRAYDPTLGRFLQRDPLGRAPLFFGDQPYAYAGNNPLVNTDLSGELIARPNGGSMSAAQQTRAAQYTQRVARVQARHPVPVKQRSCAARGAHPNCHQIDSAKQIAAATAAQLLNAIHTLGILRTFGASGALQRFLNWQAPWWLPAALLTAAKVITLAVVTAGAVIIAQLVAASALFQVQSRQPDSFWENAAAVSTSREVIETDIALLGGLIVALGVVVALLASNPLTVAIGIGLAVGGALGLIPVLKIAMDGLARERQALGY